MHSILNFYLSYIEFKWDGMPKFGQTLVVLFFLWNQQGGWGVGSWRQYKLTKFLAFKQNPSDVLQHYFQSSRVYNIVMELIIAWLSLWGQAVLENFQWVTSFESCWCMNQTYCICGCKHIHKFEVCIEICTISQIELQCLDFEIVWFNYNSP